ncbi:hypothetical protein ACFRCW_18910 [Streptomyces sp. NPDC056653]|uniref:hypothetical protein n=1 Tax=Streptomyces sp. NPDC056653 TaxID=3345894 RepID=UPI0036AC728D
MKVHIAAPRPNYGVLETAGFACDGDWPPSSERLVTADRWIPSFRQCSACAALTEKMPLNVCEWTREGCGATHDRGVNEAINSRPPAWRLVSVELV